MYQHGKIFRKLCGILTAGCTALTTLTAAGMLPALTAYAAGGSCGTNATWSYSGGTLTISGTGAASNISWTSYKSEITSVIIENGITALPAGAFMNYPALKSASLPASMTSVTTCAFYGCTALSDLSFAEGITAIEDYAFTICIGLTELTLPDSLLTIGNNAFNGNNITELSLGSNLQTIGKSAFDYSCFSEVVIPDSVQTIGANAFGISYASVTFKNNALSGQYVDPATYVTLYGKAGGAAQTYAAGCSCNFVASGTPSHTHVWSDWVTVKAATCAEAGTEKRTCSGCGDTETREIPATGHAWGEWKQDLAPTCTEEGRNVRVCANCGEKEYQAVPALGHAWSEWTVTVAPTLDSEGTEERTCANCGETETRPIPALTGYTVAASAGAGGSITPSGNLRVAENGSISFTVTPDDGFEIAGFSLDSIDLGPLDAYTLKNITEDHQVFVTFKQIEQQHGENDHVWSEWTVEIAATCTAEGKMVRTCTICGEKEYQSIPAAGHSWGDWETFVAATCTEKGQLVRVCTVCGEKEYVDIPATGHAWGEWKTLIAATCTEDGQDYRECANCGEKEYQTVPALGHDWGEWVVVREPALDEDGLETRTCANCGETESRAIPALAGFTVNASAGIGGSISPEGSVRVESGKDITFTVTPDDGYEIAGVSVDGSDAGAVASYTFKKIGEDHQIFASFRQIQQQHGADDHVWSEWTVETPAGCTTDGRMIRTCTVCGEAEYQAIPATGHAWGEWLVFAEPTCTEDGQNVRVCTNCGEMEYETVPAIGHSWGEWQEYIKPTCTEEGKNIRVCANCSEVEFQSVPATGHKWSEWKIVHEPTVTQEGLEMRTCENCGEVELRSIPKLEAAVFTISASCNDGGTVTPGGNTEVTEGSSQTYTFKAQHNYEIEDVLIDGVSVGAVSEYTFSEVSANHTVFVSFKKKEAAPPKKECTNIIIFPQRLVYFTDETAFLKNDFIVMAYFTENGTTTQEDITASFKFSGSPAEMAKAGKYKYADYAPEYTGNDSAVVSYLTQNSLTARIYLSMLGDSNGDGVIDTKDSMLALKAFAASISFLDSPLTDLEAVILDVDKDGYNTLTDSMAILRYFAYTLSSMDPTWEDVIK